MKDKIICLVGPSGSGKTTIAKRLEKLGYNIIESYTTRKPRHPGEWGHTFIDKDDKFYKELRTSEGEFDGLEWSTTTKMVFAEEMIAYKKIYGEHYFATRGQYKGQGTSIYVVDSDGAKQVKEKVKDAEVVTIALNVDEAMRLGRMLEQNRDSTESMDRVIKDRKVFKVIKCDYSVDASGEIEEVLEEVINIIKRGCEHETR